jgi:preprotein translocase subunit SecF
VTGLLTILGFSLYDTVVVFDKVRENTKNLKQSRRTYAELANLAINQTLVRSVNTSFVALLPVGALLYVGVASLGSGDLKDLSLSLFVGMAAGAYSSIFIATPLAVQLKSSEKAITQQDARAKARQRRDADRYADVPAFTDDLPMTEGEQYLATGDDDPDDAPPTRVQAPPRRPEASGSGRVVPEAKRPTSEGGSSRRAQPTRQPRSKRGR